MNILPPCGTCPRKGCGAYHAECTEYKAYREQIDARHKAQTEASVKRQAPLTPISIQSKRLKEKSKRRRNK